VGPQPLLLEANKPPVRVPLPRPPVEPAHPATYINRRDRDRESVTRML
jgi:hypothetical protein